jgi:hypothetical protein
MAYDLLVVGDAATYLISAVLILRLPPLPRVSTGVRSSPGQALRDRRFMAASGAAAVLSLHSVVLTLIIPLWIVSRTAAPAAAASAVLVTNTMLTVLLAVRMSHGVTTAAVAGRTVRRGGLLLAAAMVLCAATAGLSTGYAIALLLATTVLYTIGDLWHAAGGAGIAYNLADPRAIGEYQGVDQLLNGVVRAVGPALLTLLILDGGTAGWVATAALFAVTGLLMPGLIRWAASASASTCPSGK